jgi:hypothetical protein
MKPRIVLAVVLGLLQGCGPLDVGPTINGPCWDSNPLNVSVDQVSGSELSWVHSSLGLSVQIPLGREYTLLCTVSEVGADTKITVIDDSHDSTAEITTDANGVARYTSRATGEPGVYYIEFTTENRCGEHVSESVHIDINGPKLAVTVDPDTVVIAAPKTVYKYRIRVTAAGLPIEGASVEVSDPFARYRKGYDEDTLTTDSEGIALYEGISSQAGILPFTVRAWKMRYGNSDLYERDLIVRYGEGVTLKVEPEAEVVVPRSQPYSYSLRTYRNGGTWGGVEIDVIDSCGSKYSHPIRMDSYGQATYTALANYSPGLYTIQFITTGYYGGSTVLRRVRVQ